jgi:uncharacterized protein YecT (DUF1311 family)
MSVGDPSRSAAAGLAALRKGSAAALRLALVALALAALLVPCRAMGAEAEESETTKLTMRISQIDQTLETCITKAKGSTKGILACYDVATKGMDGVMEEFLAMLLAGLAEHPRYAESLRRDQSAWVAMRDEAVGHVKAVNGSGNVSRIAGGEHRLWLTRNRAEMLLALALAGLPSD